MKWIVNVLLASMIAFCLAGCGGGGGGGNGAGSPYKGHYTVDFTSTDSNPSIASSRVYRVEFQITGGNEITGGRVVHVPTGEILDESEVISGKITTDLNLYVTSVKFWAKKLPGQSVTGIAPVNGHHAIEGNTDSSGTIIPHAPGQSDPQQPVECDLVVIEYGTGPDFGPDGGRATTYHLKWSRSN